VRATVVVFEKLFFRIIFLNLLAIRDSAYQHTCAFQEYFLHGAPRLSHTKQHACIGLKCDYIGMFVLTRTAKCLM
jgi:hypothetical protein